MNKEKRKILSILEQGSFTAGGIVIKNEGIYNYQNPIDPDGQTLHGDHAYVFYQIPENAKHFPIVFLHGAGESGKTWETTPDGRDGFQNIFLREGYSVYIVDQPRRGRAGKGTIESKIPNQINEQLWFNTFRLGHYPDFYEGTQFPTDSESIEEFFRWMTPNTADYDENIVSDAMAKVFEKTGDGILVTHSQGCGPGWLTAIKNSKVKAIIALEPGSGFVFSEKEKPEPMDTISPFGALSAETISDENFEKLTKIPIVIIYGDNIAEEKSEDWIKDHWRVRLQMAKLWIDTINKYGGNAKLIELSKLEIKGNTHFLFADKNNLEIAKIIKNWLKEQSLDL